MKIKHSHRHLQGKRTTIVFGAALTLVQILMGASAQIPHPDDAPEALSPAESAKAFQVPPGMRIKLLAAEPLVIQPMGICWDEWGRLFVAELHGYNLEGQYDIDELNKSGKLDMEVRRIQATEESRKRAEKETYGTVKLLLDTDGDGVMDKAEVWADHLPPCYGLTAGNGGIIVACAPDILFLKDSDGDNRPDVREKLFTGFSEGILERRINAPIWGIDDWIYFGKGGSGGTITGPHLQEAVKLPATDFRIRADGTAIEPVSGGTQTIGATFTPGGDRFVTNTTHPGLFVTPVPWRYLMRNPDAAAPLLVEKASEDTEVFPIAGAHPWRVKREKHAEYFAYYKKYSLSDAAASGYFTSACGPLVYRDHLLPGLRGDYLVCEPAQNLVHRSRIVRDGTRLRLERKEGERDSEFLASRDGWFHPIALSHTPEGGIGIVDFYREIIEDYSAIPRHLQQQYGLVKGSDRGRLWLLAPEEEQGEPKSRNLAALDEASLGRELESDIYWRRRTAQRLLEERGKLPADFYLGGWVRGDDPGARVTALRTADEHHFDSDIAKAIESDLIAGKLGNSPAPQLVLQVALSLGQSKSPKAMDALVRLTRLHGDLRWMDAAIASSVAGREKGLLLALATDPGKGEAVMVNLAGIIAARGNAVEIESGIAGLVAAKSQGKPLEVLRLGLEDTKPIGNPIEVPVPEAPTAEQVAQMEKRVPGMLTALKQKPNLDEGRTFFTAICATCHRSKGIGVVVGPDLDAEFQRAPEVILRDILFPSEAASPGYETVLAKTQRGETLLGIIASESPTSVTLRLPGGVERTLLRKRASIQTLRNISLMPAGIGATLSPGQVANIIAFLRQPPK